jgi:hypothetical protein
MTPSGIESATFRFVAQHLNHCATAVRRMFTVVELMCHMMFFLGRLHHVDIEKRTAFVFRVTQLHFCC